MRAPNSEATNRQVALDFFRAFWATDLDAAFAWLTPDARFLLMPTVAPVRDNDARTALTQIIDTMFSAFAADEGLNCTVTSLVADGDEVAMEYVARARTRSGQAYENFYSAHLTLREGKIAVLRTYADTKYLFERLMAM